MLTAPELRSFIATHKLTQGQYADLIGISHRRVRDWLAGNGSCEGPAEILTRLMVARPGLVEAVRKLGNRSASSVSNQIEQPQNPA